MLLSWACQTELPTAFPTARSHVSYKFFNHQPKSAPKCNYSHKLNAFHNLICVSECDKSTDLYLYFITLSVAPSLFMAVWFGWRLRKKLMNATTENRKVGIKSGVKGKSRKDQVSQAINNTYNKHNNNRGQTTLQTARNFNYYELWNAPN